MVLPTIIFPVTKKNDSGRTDGNLHEAVRQPRRICIPLFDRIVILGHLPLLTRPENIVHFFRDVCQSGAITKEVLRKRTDEYSRWVESFARNQRIPIEWAEKGVRKEDYVRPRLRQMERGERFGVYFILKSMEVGPSFRSAEPKFKTEDPDYRIIAAQRSRYTHFYFYIRDEVLGPMAMCVGSFLPFRISYYLNGHNFIERELLGEGVVFRKDDNAFLGADDPEALQAAADRLSDEIIRKRLDYWTFFVGPKFSKKDRESINLSRHYSVQQVEYCRNVIFRRNFPIQTLRAFVRHRARAARFRQDHADLRLPDAQAAARETAICAREVRAWSPCPARLRKECCAANVREVRHPYGWKP